DAPMDAPSRPCIVATRAAEWEVLREGREVMGYVYRYTTNYDKPATRCPGCGQDWTAAGGVEIELVVASVRLWGVRSRLVSRRTLVDTEGWAVFHGRHSGTRCAGGCGLLADIGV